LERLEPRVLLANSTPWPVTPQTVDGQSVESNADGVPSGANNQTTAMFEVHGPRALAGLVGVVPRHYEVVLENGQLAQVIPTSTGSASSTSASWTGGQIATHEWSHARLDSLPSNPNAQFDPTQTQTSSLTLPSWAQAGGVISAAGWSPANNPIGHGEPPPGPMPSPPEGLPIMSLNGYEGGGGSNPIYVSNPGWSAYRDSLSASQPQHDYRFAFDPNVVEVWFEVGSANSSAPPETVLELLNGQGAILSRSLPQPGQPFEDAGVSFDQSFPKGPQGGGSIVVRMSVPSEAIAFGPQSPGSPSIPEINAAQLGADLTGVVQETPNPAVSSIDGSSQAASTTGLTPGTSTDYVLYMYVIRQSPLNTPELSNSSPYVPWESSATIQASHPIGEPLDSSPSIESPLAQATEEETEHVSSESTSMEWQPGLVLVATGPLPSRTAAPLGGVLASGDPVPLVDHRDAAVIDLALLDLVGVRHTSPVEEAVPSFVDEQASSRRDAEDVGLALAGRGLGGLPLLGSSLTEMVRSNRKGALPSIDQGEEDENGRTSATRPEPALPTSGTDMLVTDSDSDSGVSPRLTNTRRIAALAGASIVGSLAAGLVVAEFSGMRFQGVWTWRRIRRLLRMSGPDGRAVRPVKLS
jgi:hypothetical protein